MCVIYIATCLTNKYIQAVTRSVQDELSKLEFKVMMQKRNVEQLENKMKLLELNIEEFKLEKMVYIYVYIHMCNKYIIIYEAIRSVLTYYDYC